jgi:predicted dehydrogenase
VTRALVVGAGSIGLRHGEVLAGLGLEVGFVTQRTDVSETCFTGVADAMDKFSPEYVVVANETARHGATVAELVQIGFAGKVLVEKPLSVSGIDVSNFSTFGVGYNLRFHPLIEALAEAVTSTTVLTVEVYAGQHLATWRPARTIAHQYSGSAELGGGVLRDLSHELDYLDLLLGPCTGVFARGGRFGEVTVDSDDAWGIVASYEFAPLVTIQLNYLDTQTRRRIVANTSGSTIEADFIGSTLRVDGRIEQFATERNDSYVAMHRAMISDDGKRVTRQSEAERIDALIATIERSAAERSWLGV